MIPTETTMMVEEEHPFHHHLLSIAITMRQHRRGHIETRSELLLNHGIILQKVAAWHL